MKCVVTLLVLFVAACSPARQLEGARLAQAAGWRWEIVTAGGFDLMVASSPRAGNGTLVVYLEGDGFAFVHANQPAIDPTPTDPVALRLALSDPTAAAVAWIARPCQYTLPHHGRGCQTAVWTAGRYSPEVVESVGAALESLKQRSGAARLVLVGYSGGGALAVLLAVRHADVDKVVTVAANLDLDYWTRRDGLAPLTGSLDPAREIVGHLGAAPQIHFTGGKDRTVGTDVVQSYLRALPPNADAQLVVVPEFTHSCCWVRDWPVLAANIGW